MHTLVVLQVSTVCQKGGLFLRRFSQTSACHILLSSPVLHGVLVSGVFPHCQYPAYRLVTSLSLICSVFLQKLNCLFFVQHLLDGQISWLSLHLLFESVEIPFVLCTQSPP